MSDKQKSDEDLKPSSSSDEKGLKGRVKKALVRFFVRRPEKKELEARNILPDTSDDRKLRAKQLELRLSTRLSKDTLEQLHILQPEPDPVSPPLSPTGGAKSTGVRRIRDKVNRKASQLREFVRKTTRKDIKSHDDTDLPKKEKSARNLDAQSRRAKYSRKSRSMPAVVRSRKNDAHVFGGSLPNMDMKNVGCEGQLLTVPLIATVCVEYLLPKIELEGIFRVSGNHTDIERVKRQIDKTRQYHVIAQCDNPNTVAGIFKSFFRELAEPLLTFAQYARFVAAAAPDKNSAAPNDEEARVRRAEQLKSVLTSLPKENYELLLYLVWFLVKVSQSSKVNLMDSRNLSLIWGSIVLRDEHEDTTSVTALTNTSQQAAVMALLIDHYDLIFKAKNSPPVKPVNNTPPNSMSATTTPSPSASMTSTLNREPMMQTQTPVNNVTPVNGGALPQTFSSPALLSQSRPIHPAVGAPLKTPGTAPPKSRGPQPAPPPRVKAATMKTPVKTAAVKFNSVEVPSNTNRAPNNSTKPAEHAAPKNSPPKNTIPVLGAAYPVSTEKRGTVPGDGTNTAEPKSEPLRARAITAGHADKDAHSVNSAPAPRSTDKTQPRAAANPMLQTVGPVLTTPVTTPVKRTVPAVAPPSAAKEPGPLSPPSTGAAKKAVPKTPGQSNAASSGPPSAPLPLSPKVPVGDKASPQPASLKAPPHPTPYKIPPPPPPRAKTPLLTSPKEPRRSYSLQTLN